MMRPRSFRPGRLGHQPARCAICGDVAPADFRFDAEPGVIVHPSCLMYTRAAELTDGEHPSRALGPGQRVQQTCGDQRCVNPAHLIAVSA